MRHLTKIDYPPSGRVNLAMAGFAAFGGVSPRHRRVRCLLFYRDRSYIEGEPLVPHGGHFWAVAFRDVKPGPQCTLELRDAETDLLIDFVSELDLEHAYGAPTITYPHATDNPIPSNFVAYGADTTTVTGGTMDNGTNNVAASSIASSGAGPWFLTFKNVPAGQHYTLTVTDTLLGSTADPDLEVVAGP